MSAVSPQGKSMSCDGFVSGNAYRCKGLSSLFFLLVSPLEKCLENHWMLRFLHPPTQIQQPEIQTLEVWEGKGQPFSNQDRLYYWGEWG